MRKVLLLSAALMLAGCDDAAKVASDNLTKAADNFEINRRIVFYNGITGGYLLEIEGLCSIGSGSSVPKEITVTCKTAANSYKKHFLGLSDNVTFFAEQLEPAQASIYRYRVTFNPTVIIPDIRTP